jgi:membrane protein
VKKTILEVTQSSSGGKLTIGILVAFWAASAGFDSIRVALNMVYGLKEDRAWWRTKLLSLLFTLVITLLTGIALGTVFYGWKFISFSFSAFGLPIPSYTFLVIIEWVVTLGVLLLVFDLIYNLAPARKSFKWVWVTPGGITGIILWLILSSGFRLYLQYYNTYDRTYGSLGAVIILLLWLYLTALVILVGGVINSVLHEMAEENPIKTAEIKKFVSKDDLEIKT